MASSSFVARAYKSHQRGDSLRGVFVLITGLRRDPSNDEAIDALIEIYSLSSNITGLEHEIIEVLGRREDADQVLSVLYDNMKSVGNNDAAETLLSLGTEANMGYIPPPKKIEPLKDTPLTRSIDTISKEEILKEGLQDSVLKSKLVSSTFEIPEGVEYEPEAETLELDRDVSDEIFGDNLEDTLEDIREGKAPKLLIKYMLLVFFVLVVSSVGIGLFLKDNATQCLQCEAFDTQIVRWPSSTEALMGMDEVTPEMVERRLFLKILSGDAPENLTLASSPKTWYGIATYGILRNQLCAERQPMHIAITWCRITYFLTHDDIAQAERESQSLKIAFPGFQSTNTQNSPDEKHLAYSDEDPMRIIMQSLFTDFIEIGKVESEEEKALYRYLSQYPGSEKAKTEHVILQPIIEALDLIYNNKHQEAEDTLREALKKGSFPSNAIALVQAIFPRAFLYAGDPKRAASFSAPLGGQQVDGDENRPVALKTNPLNSAIEIWEAEEAVFSRAELLAELGYVNVAKTVLGQMKDIGAAFIRTQEMEEMISCVGLSDCKRSKTKLGKTIAHWLASDVDAEIGAKRWDGFLWGNPGRTLDFKPSGALNRWWYTRIQLVAAAMHGRENAEYKSLRKRFVAIGSSAELARGLSFFWQGSYTNAIRQLMAVPSPIAKGFSGLSNRAIGESAKGNQELNEAGLRFDKVGGADFELGILNMRLGNKPKANEYFWKAWTQDWSRENALTKWCETNEFNQYSKVKRKLKGIDQAAISMDRKQGLLAIREICLASLSSIRTHGKITKLPTREEREDLPFWVLQKHGEFAFLRGDFSTARTFYEKAMEKNPTNSDVLFGAGRCAEKDHDFPVAKKLANRYIHLWPNGIHVKWAKEMQSLH